MATTLMLSFLFVAGCGRAPIHNWPAVEGRVIDKSTGDPVAGAYVIALWQGVAAHSSSVCFHVESAISDENGNYLIPSWRNDYKFETSGSQEIILRAHKSGYMEVDVRGNTVYSLDRENYDSRRVFRAPTVSGIPRLKTDSTVQRDVLLQPFVGGRDRNTNYLLYLHSSLACVNTTKENYSILKDIFKSIYEDAITTVDDETKSLEVLKIRRSYESIVYGGENAQRMFIERADKSNLLNY